jgi:hypothetical protein
MYFAGIKKHKSTKYNQFMELISKIFFYLRCFNCLVLIFETIANPIKDVVRKDLCSVTIYVKYSPYNVGSPPDDVY